MRRRYQYIPTGNLFLKIGTWGIDGLQKSWSDRKTTRLGTCLNDFIVGLIKIAEAAKVRRCRQEEEERLRREAQLRRQEEAQRQEEELIRRRALEQEAANWNKARQLRNYLAALKGMLVSKHGEVQSGSPADQWLRWAH